MPRAVSMVHERRTHGTIGTIGRLRIRLSRRHIGLFQKPHHLHGSSLGSPKDQDVAPNETTQILKELLSDPVRKSWDATRLMKTSRKENKQQALRKLWAEKRMTEFDPGSGPHINFS
jgi:hypothetical protein